MAGIRIHITGIVQGVGMRPFVYREAVAHGVAGWVLNASDGVHIEAHAEPRALERFVAALRQHAPAASRIEGIAVTPLGDDARPTEPGAFSIRGSDASSARTTLVSPDIATCPDCLRELFDPADRRYHYPFINCTNCGPRFTIIRDLPYDRPLTSMGAFPMCPSCAAEYADPLDRRFHAQPDACFECGPHITWREAGQGAGIVGSDLATSDAIIDRCAQLISAGGIVAIKGLGGFHLACDAASEHAIAELRRRKHRGNKPLAIMVANVGDAELLCHVDESERAVLCGSVRPIVLLARKSSPAAALGHGAELAHGVALDLPELGIMLPYTPLQHLLLAACAERGVRALVMTSGNASGRPIEVDDARAWENLVESGLADALLGNDRAILARYDDSVVRVEDGRPVPVRRARGYAPQPLPLPASGRGGDDAPCILACGAEQKATLALTRELADGGASCFLSQHIGDVEGGEVLDAWHDARRKLQGLFGLEPAALACDLHPGYLTSQWARAEAAESGMRLVEVQHHHAHVASVIAEATARGELDVDARVVGIALDGTGAGTDGTVWGGELLVADLRGFSRAAHLAPWPLPGGAASIRDPRRCALALLHELQLLDHPGAAPLLHSIPAQERAVTEAMTERRLNCPLTSSAGRLFDAVSALTGICRRASYDGEPAIELEAAARRAARGPRTDAAAPETPGSEAGPASALAAPPASAPTTAPAPPAAETAPTTPATEAPPRALDLRPVLRPVLDGIARGEDADAVALEFHRDLAELVVRAAIDIARAEGIRDVALSGGVFMNRLLLERVRRGLSHAGLRVHTPRTIPFNDGCIAYGQAAVARARLGGA